MRIPWVAEFRDPWYPAPGPVRQRLDRWLLGLILWGADSVVIVTKGFENDLKLSYPRSSNKLVLIRNGYDEEDFEKDRGAPNEILPPGYLHLTHLGTIYSGHSGNFFPALAELLEENADLRQTVRVNVIGFPDTAVREFADHPTLHGVLQLRSFVRHDEALQYMAASDCLLIFLGNRDFSRGAVSGKLFEYLRCGRPILAIAYEGDLKHLIEAAGVGWVVEPEDTQTIKQVLLTVLQGGARTHVRSHFSRNFVEQFRYDRLAGRLVEVLNSVVGHGS